MNILARTGHLPGPFGSIAAGRSHRACAIGRAVIPAIALSLPLAGCGIPSLGPKPAITTPATLATTQSLAAPVAGWPDAAWWQTYHDPQLNALMDEAFRTAPDMRVAMARVRIARGAAEQAGAALMPSAGASGRVDIEKQSYNMGFPPEFVPHGWLGGGQAELDFGLDLDLWGRNRAALAAATSEARAAEVDAAQARLLLSTDIATAYADLAGLFLQRDVTVRAVAVRMATLDLARQRVRIGLDNRGPEELARSRLPQTRADLAAIDEQIGLVRNRLAALVGAGPDRGLAITRPVLGLTPPLGLPPSLALGLVGRRPDLVAARLRSEAAASRIAVAHADFFPDINLMAFIGVESLGLSQLVESGSTIGHAGPAVTLPIFQGGRLAGAYRGARAQYDRAVADYDGTLVRALREVADVVTSLRALDERQRETTESLAAADRAYDIAMQRYRGGLATYQDALTAEDTLLDRRTADALLRARALTLNVALVRALGGGFLDQIPTKG